LSAASFCEARLAEPVVLVMMRVDTTSPSVLTSASM